MRVFASYFFQVKFDKFKFFKPNPPLETRTCELMYGNLSCCDRKQTEWIKYNGLKMIKPKLQHCPACLYNIWSLWYFFHHFEFNNFRCGYLCSPNQSQFVEVTSFEDSTGKVLSVNISLHHNFAKNVYSSCKDVRIDNTSTIREKFNDNYKVCNISLKLNF